MSRLGKIPIALPEKVEATLKDGVVRVKGPKGELHVNVKPGLRLEKREEGLLVGVENARLLSRMHGLYRALIKNMVIAYRKDLKNDYYSWVWDFVHKYRVRYWSSN